MRKVWQVINELAGREKTLTAIIPIKEIINKFPTKFPRDYLDVLENSYFGIWVTDL